MKRKIFSTLLFGALAFVSLSTVTSCKDYDDDINNLQSQIDKMALKTDVEALQATVAANKTAAESALASAKADLEAQIGTKASQTALDAVKATAEQAAADVANAVAQAAEAKSNAAEAKAAAAAAQADATQALADAAAAANAAAAAQTDATAALTRIGNLEATVVTTTKLAEELDDLKEEILAATDEKIEELDTKVKAFKGGIEALYAAVTEVSLVGSFNKGQGHDLVYGSTVDLEFEATTVPDNLTFGKDMADGVAKATNANNPYQYTKGARVDFPQTILVRINPVNANITPEMIKLIDSKGNDLDKLIKVKSVAKFDGLLSRATATGLWTVELALADGVDKDKVERLTEVSPGNFEHILYAVAVNNTVAQKEAVEDAANRYVVSTYDITVLATTPYTGATSLAGLQFKSETQQPTWTNLQNITGRGTCNVSRTSANDLLAASGENIYVRFTQGDLTKVDRFYIVRDDNYAEAYSSPSEINVWKTYQYTGLGDMVEVKNGTGIGTFTVTIPSNLATGDQVAFRIYAVNYDGTLVDPNGESFNVMVVNPQNASTAIGNIIAYDTNPTSEFLPVTGKLVGETLTLPSTVTLKEGDHALTYNVKYYSNNNGNGTLAGKNKDVKFIKLELASGSIQSWTDDATGTGNITSLGSNNEIVNNIAVSLTKVLPDAAWTKANHKYSWKGEQVKDGVFTAYLFNAFAGNTWNNNYYGENNGAGYKDLNDVLNGFKDGYEYVVDNAMECDGSHWHADGKTFYDNDLKVKANVSTIMRVSNEKDDANAVLIDNSTKRASTLQYNYGYVTSKKENGAYIEHVVPVETFETVFACPLNANAQKYDWKQYDVKDDDGNVVGHKDMNVLTWNSADPAVTDEKIGDYIIGKNAFDPAKFAGTFNDKGVLYHTVKAELLTKSNGEKDYFDVEYIGGELKFTPIASSSNPVADVPSTLKLTLTDAFGHKNVYSLDFTVKRAQ